MATDLHNASEPSLSSLVSGIVTDAQQLIRQEMALAKREVTDELNKTKEAAIALGVGIGVAAVGGLLLVLMLVHLLNWAVPQIPLWGCYAIVGGALTIFGIALVFLGKSKVERIHLMPRQTVETMKENVQWIKNQT